MFSHVFVMIEVALFLIYLRSKGKLDLQVLSTWGILWKKRLPLIGINLCSHLSYTFLF